ncbi:hypothetical protein [Akkermansia sp.]|uniref:hypothetical protein n=1 Tax=Akkermansia sp. TaxID=1872421 RepID=UPI003AB19671
MSDKNYDIQVNIKANADLAGFEQTQQALDSIRNKARAVSGSSTNTPAEDVKELTEEMKEAVKIGTDLEQSLNDVSAGAEQIGTTVSEAGADAGQSLKDTSASSERLGESLSKTGRKGTRAMGDVERSTAKTKSRLSGLRGTVVLAFNALNDLKSMWNTGVGIGDWIWEKWEKNIKGIDRAAEKRKQEALDARIREEKQRNAALQSTTNETARDSYFSRERKAVDDINELYRRRLELIGEIEQKENQLLDHLAEQQQIESDMARTAVSIGLAEGRISKEEASAMLEDIDATDKEQRRQLREKREQVKIEAARKQKEAAEWQQDSINAELDEAGKHSYSGVSYLDYMKMKNLEAQHNDSSLQESRRKEMKEMESELLKARQDFIDGINQNDEAAVDTAKKKMEYYTGTLEELEELTRKEKEAVQKVETIDAELEGMNIISLYSSDAEQKQNAQLFLDAQQEHIKGLKEQSKSIEQELEVSGRAIQDGKERLKVVEKLNAQDRKLAALKHEETLALAAKDRRESTKEDIASQVVKVQDRFKEQRANIEDSEQFKQYGNNPAVAEAMKKAAAMSRAGFMSEQDAATLARLREGVAEARLPRELKSMMKAMLSDLIKGFSGTHVNEQTTYTPRERAELEGRRFKEKLDVVSNETRNRLPKDGAAEQMLNIMKDSIRYGELNDATVQKLKSLMMRIDQDDKPGMKIVELVHDLIDGKMKKIFQDAKQTQNRKPQASPVPMEDKKAKPRRITPEGRDLDAEEEMRQRIRSGNYPPQSKQPDTPQPVNENELVSRMMQSFSNEQNTGNRMLAMMNTIITALQSRDASQKEFSSRLSSMETRLSGIESREKFGRR